MNQQKKEELRYSAGLERESDIGIVSVRDTGGTDRRDEAPFDFILVQGKKQFRT